MTTGRYTYYFTIEGLGKVGAVTASGDSYLWRFATGPVSSSVDTDGLVKPWWRHSGDREKPFRLPSMLLKLDYRTGRFTVEGTTFKLVAVQGDADVDVREALLRPRHYKIGDIQSAISETGAIIAIGSTATGYANTEVGCKRERIKLGSHLGAGVYGGCRRYIHGTPQTDHDPDRYGEDTEVYLTQHAIQGRKVTLYALPETATSLADEQEIWSGVLKECGYTDVTQVHIQCTGVMGLLTNARLLASSWCGEIVANGSSVHIVIQTAPSLDRLAPRWPATLSSAATAGSDDDYILVRIKDSVFKAYYGGGDQTTGAQLVVNLFQPLFGTEALTREDVNVGDVAREFIHASPDAPAIYAGGSSGTQLGGSDGSFITVLLQVLTSTPYGTNGSDDTGLDFGVRLPASMLDRDGFLEVGYALGEDALLRRVFVGADDEAPLALDWIEGYTKALQMGFTLTDDGLLGMELFGDSPTEGTVEVSLTDSDLLDLVSVGAGIQDIIDVVEATYNRQPTGDDQSLDTELLTRQQRTLGSKNKESLDLGGYDDLFKALRRARVFIERWARPNPIISFAVPLSTRIRPGITCQITSSQILGIDANGDLVEGVSGVRAVIQEEEIDLEGQARRYKGRLTSIGLKLGSIPPFAIVDSPPGSGTTWNIKSNIAQPSSGGVFARDSDQFRATDVLKHTDQYGQQIATGLTLASTGTDQLVFTGTPGTAPVAGDIFVMDDYDRQSSDQQERWITVCDTSGLLGTANDPAFQYEG